MSLKRKRQMLALAWHVTIMVLFFAGMAVGGASGRENLFVLSGVAFFACALTLRVNPLPRLLGSWVIRETHCRECGQPIDLVGLWKCGCGFTTWRPRHAFSPCPNCRRIFSWLVCPSCEASIPI